MTKTLQDFTLWQGESATVTAAVTDSNDAAVDMTGATVTWEATGDNDTLTITGSLVNVNATNDGVQIAFVPNDTKSLPAKTYAHECRVVSAGGDHQIVFVGKFILKPSTTKPA